MATKVWSENEYTYLLSRITAVEDLLNVMQTALNGVATKQQMKALLALRQAEVTDLQARVTALESQIAILQDA